MSLRANGKTFSLLGERSAESQRFLLVLDRESGLGEVLGRVDGDFDEDRSEVRVTAPLALLRPHLDLTRGTRITPIVVDTFRSQGVADRPLPVGPPISYLNGIGADSASGGSSAYVAGSPSCVRP